MEAQLAKNSLVLEQSLESNGRKIASNFKNLNGENVFVLISYYNTEKDIKTTLCLGCLPDRLGEQDLLDRTLMVASEISNSFVSGISFPFLLFIRDR